MSAWMHKVYVQNFVLLGGEPTIHPGLSHFPIVVRKHWPKAAITIITNGFFLNRHPDLPKALADCGNARLSISVHHESAEYDERLKPMLELAGRWREDFDFQLEVIRSYKRWTRRYTGFGDTMMPFEDANARRSWEICPARDCRQLFDGRIWKCSPIAYLRLQGQTFNLSRKWDLYLKYASLEMDCTESEISEFLEKQEEEICTMCSAERRTFDLPNPMRRVRERH